MRRLTLLRHAKASRDDPALRDFDRPLTGRGRRDAARIGAHLAARGFAPDAALCSPSLRTRETLEIASAEFGPAPRTLFPERLYDASPGAVLAALAAVPAEAREVLVVGHNPSLHLVALNLVDFARSDPGAAMLLGEGFPTGAVVQFDLDIPRWTEIAEARGALRHFATPKNTGAEDD